MSLVFENKIPVDKTAFADKVIRVSSELNINPNWLMAVMWAESKLNPAAENLSFPVNGGYATGLIQFTPDTARRLGTSVAALKLMTGVKQLDYVKKYLSPYANRLLSYRDVYLSVFFPLAIGKPDEWVFESSKLSRSSIARSNPVIDRNQDGKITMKEFEDYLRETIPLNLRDLIFSIWNKVINNKGIIALIVAAFLILRK